MELNEAMLRAAFKKLGRFGTLFLEYSGDPRGHMGRAGCDGGEYRPDRTQSLIAESQMMDPVVDVDGNVWRPVLEKVLKDMVDTLRETAPPRVERRTKLRPCPFCKQKKVYISVHDDEGNYKGELGCEYELQAWSGLSYALHHEGWGDCLLCTCDDEEVMGGMLFDTAEEAADAWNGMAVPEPPREEGDENA